MNSTTPTETGVDRVVPLSGSEHRRQVVTLYAEVFGRAKAKLLEERFVWQYRENPARRPGQVTNWVFLRGDRVIGHMGVVPVTMQVDGTTLRGGWCCDLVIHPAHRRHGRFKALLAILDAELPMGYGMTEIVGRTYARRGYLRLGIGSHLVRFATTAGALRLRAPRASGSPSWIGAGLAEQFRNLRRRAAAPRRLPPDLGRWQTELVDHPSAEFGKLWRRIAGDYPVAAVRDLPYLIWRYASWTPARFLLLRRQGRLEACAVLETFRWRGVRAGQISELLMPRSEASTLVPILAGLAYRTLKRQGVDIVLTVGFPSDVRRALARSGFHPLAADREEILVALNRRGQLSDALLSEPDSWLLTAGDSDRSLSYPRLPWRI